MKAVTLVGITAAVASAAACGDSTGPSTHGAAAEITYTGTDLSTGRSMPWYVTRPDGSGRRELIDRVADLSWSPDGGSIAYWYYNEDFMTAEILDMHTGQITLLAPTARQFQWSPDGSSLAYVDEEGGGLWVVTRDGSDARLLTSSGHEVELRWSPDGRYILYIQQYGSSQYLEYASVIDGETETFDLGGINISCAEWSPDGSQIVVCSGGRPELIDPHPHSGLFRLNAGAGTLTPIASGEQLGAGCFAVGSDWSEQGILFVVVCHGDTYRMSAYFAESDGSGLQQLATEESWHFVWSDPNWQVGGGAVFVIAGVLYFYEDGVARAVPVQNQLLVEQAMMRPPTSS